MHPLDVSTPSSLVGKWLSKIFINSSMLCWCQMGLKMFIALAKRSEFFETFRTLYCFTCMQISMSFESRCFGVIFAENVILVLHFLDVHTGCVNFLQSCGKYDMPYYLCEPAVEWSGLATNCTLWRYLYHRWAATFC